jgi:hypothetical protein
MCIWKSVTNLLKAMMVLIVGLVTPVLALSQSYISPIPLPMTNVTSNNWYHTSANAPLTHVCSNWAGCPAAGGSGNVVYISSSTTSNARAKLASLTVNASYRLDFLCAQYHSGAIVPNIALTAVSGLTFAGGSTSQTFVGLATAQGGAAVWGNCTVNFTATATTGLLNFALLNASGTQYVYVASPSVTQVSAAPLVATQAVATKTLTAGQAGASFTPVTGSGGTGALNYSVSPALPTGLAMAPSTGQVSGTPTAASGASSYTVTVVDATSASATASFTLTVAPAPTATLAIASTPLTVNVSAAAFTPVAGGGGMAPLVYSVAPALPSGLAMASATGAISGTPTAVSAQANYTTTVTDANGATASATFGLAVVQPPTPVLSFTTPAAASVALGGSLTNAASSSLSGGAYGAISYASSDPGKATVSASGVVTPVAVGTTTITATQAAVVGVNAQGTQSYTLTVTALQAPTLTFATPSPAALVVGATLGNPASSSLSGGSYGAITYASSNPAVATVNGSGVVSALSVGSSTITATQAAVAGVNAQGSRTFVLNVRALPVPTLSFAQPGAVSMSVGGSLTNPATSNLPGGEFGDISYTSADTRVATVNAAGVVTAVSDGSTTITATQAGVAGLNAPASRSYTLTVKSKNALLTSLSVSSGALSPGFASGTSGYAVLVPNTTAAITVTPAVADARATVTVNGARVASGSPSGNLALVVGANAVVIVVTAQDGITTQTYTTTVTRAAATTATLSDLRLSTGPLSPAFSSGTTSYAASVPFDASTVVVTPTPTDSHATVKVNGGAVPVGPSGVSVNLAVGANSIVSTVTAQDGISTQTYTATVTRAPAPKTQASLVLAASPSALNTVVSKSTLSTTGGSGAGAVAYAVTKGTCTLAGNVVSAGTIAETCTITATKSADATYLAATATVAIEVRQRPTLAAAANDASVGASHGAQWRHAQRFANTQLLNIGQHLDTLSHHFEIQPANWGWGLNSAKLDAVAPLLNLAKDQLQNAVRGTSQGEPQASPVNDSVNPAPVFGIWTAGAVDVMHYPSDDGKGMVNKLTTDGLTIGIDHQLGPRAIIGMALGYGTGRNTAATDANVVTAAQRAVTAYGAVQFPHQWIGDGLVGQSSLAITGERATEDGLAMLNMSRSGRASFAAASIRKVFKLGDLSVSLFGREEWLRISLAGYVESGPASYALGYGESVHTATSTAAGLHVSRDFNWQGGKLTLSAKLSANRTRTDAQLQDIYLADAGTAGGIYTLQQASTLQFTKPVQLGITYTGKNGSGIDLGWVGTLGDHQNRSRGLRIGLRMVVSTGM